MAKMPKEKAEKKEDDLDEDEKKFMEDDDLDEKDFEEALDYLKNISKYMHQPLKSPNLGQLFPKDKKYIST